MSSARENIGKQIRASREAIALSQERLAYRSGVSVKTIARIENGKNTPRPATLAVIEAALYQDDPPPVEVGRVRKVAK